MKIGYSEQTLWNNIQKQLSDIQIEQDWATCYSNIKNIEFVENCVSNIKDSCTAILENIEHLKGEPL